MARIALIGSNGQLGSDIVRLWPASVLCRSGGELRCLTHADLDVGDETQVRTVLTDLRPDVVINTAAFHRVDDIETRPDEAFRVNAVGVGHLARACNSLGASLVHFSTDYVFAGNKATPYVEADPTEPVSAYGISKAAGEHYLRYLLPRHVLVRTSGLYGVAGASGKGGNFVETMLRLAREGKPISVVDDQVCAPTYTHDLAEVVLEVIARGEYGTFHITSAGQCSWYEFARAIFELSGIEPDLSPTTSAAYGSPARRPAYSVLENAHLRAAGLQQPRHWRDALAAYLKARGPRP